MAIQKTEAIVLRSQDLRETSLVATFYTRDFGKIKGIVKGIRSPKSRYGSYLQPFTYNEIVFYERLRGDLHTISQCDLKDFFPAVRQNLAKTAYAYYFIELVDELTQTQDKNPTLFGSLLEALHLLSNEDGDKVARIFEVKLLGCLGLMPHITSCVSCGITGASEVRFSPLFGGLLCRECLAKDDLAVPVLMDTLTSLTHLNQTGWEMVARLQVSRDVAENLRELLRSFLDFQIGKRLNSLDFLEKLKL